MIVPILTWMPIATQDNGGLDIGGNVLDPYRNGDGMVDLCVAIDMCRHGLAFPSSAWFVLELKGFVSLTN
jgi:hypothetical protein